MKKQPARDDRIVRELAHADVLVESPEEIWGWGTPAGRARAERRARLLARAGKIEPGRRTLEVGCGTGLFTELVSRTGASIDACELSEKLLELARKRTFLSPVTFLNQDAMALGDAAAGTYDVVWGSSVLHHLDVEVFLAAALKLLRPGGRLVFAEPNMMNPQVFVERHLGFVRRARGVSPDETAFYRWDISRVLLRSGFVNVSVMPHEFLHPSVPSPLIPLAQGLTFVAEHVWPFFEIAGSLLIRAEKPGEEGR